MQNVHNGRNVHHQIRYSLSMGMSRLTRDGTAELVSRDKILRRERGQGNIHFSCSDDHEQDWQPYPVDPYSPATSICDDHIYIHTRYYLHCGDRPCLVWLPKLLIISDSKRHVFSLSRPRLLIDVASRDGFGRSIPPQPAYFPHRG